MKKIMIIVFAFLFCNSTCRTTEMKKNVILFENKSSEQFFLCPWKIDFDRSRFSIRKEQLYHNVLPSHTSKKMLYDIPFCMEEYWKKYVVGDSLEILVFTQDSLESGKNLRQLIDNKSYIKKISVSYDQLVNNGCQISIE